MGGEFQGALASQVVVEALPPLVRKRTKGIVDLEAAEAAEQLLTAVGELSNQIRDATKGELGMAGMGATVVLGLVRDSQALIAHMGDSRAYLVRKGRLERLTNDHSIVQLLIDEGEITLEEAVDHPARGQLRRFVGMPGEPLPEARFLALWPGDRLLLCTDGLTEMLSDEEVLTIVREKLSAKTTCKRLVSAANEAGGNDNVTALVIDVPSSSG
jgi:protein phosphatase